MLLKRQPAPARQGLDIPGVLLVSGAVFCLVYGFSNAAAHRWATPSTYLPWRSWVCGMPSRQKLVPEPACTLSGPPAMYSAGLWLVAEDGYDHADNENHYRDPYRKRGWRIWARLSSLCTRSSWPICRNRSAMESKRP